MKFSVEVETESKSFPLLPNQCKANQQLTWDIEVNIEQKLELARKSLVDAPHLDSLKVNAEPVKALNISKLEAKPRKGDAPVSAKRRVEDSESEPEEGRRERKQSKIEREEELVRKALANRKVSREGEWLVFRERIGLLTTQNGTQQIRERRVRIQEEDLLKLAELGFQ